MNYITKSISQTIVGAAVALAFTACSSSNSVAPEASVAQIKEEPSKQIRLEPQQDSTYTPPIFAISDETKETLESWLNGNPISNGITVDHWCDENHPDYPNDPFWCLPYRIQLEKGTVANVYGGSVNVIMCETYQDTIIYSVSLHNNIIKKTWTNPLFDTDMYRQSKTQFKQSCKAEFGDITEETETKIVCNVKIEPSPSQDDPSRDSRKYLKPHYFYNYLDIYWNEFASQTIEACRGIPPQIEPITTF
jgi:hypothetical protein